MDIYILSSSLDPRFKRFKYRFLRVEQYEDSIKKFLNSISIRESDFFGEAILSTSSGEPSQRNSFQDLFGDILEDDNPRVQAQPLTGEILSYMALPPLSEAELNSFNLVTWWGKQKINFPNLSKFARILHGIVATSAPSERVFSTAGNCIVEKRSRLLPSNVDKLVFLNSNLSA